VGVSVKSVRASTCAGRGKRSSTMKNVVKKGKGPVRDTDKRLRDEREQDLLKEEGHGRPRVSGQNGEGSSGSGVNVLIKKVGCVNRPT